MWQSPISFYSTKPSKQVVEKTMELPYLKNKEIKKIRIEDVDIEKFKRLSKKFSEIQDK